jgi:hypothetical protein
MSYLETFYHLSRSLQTTHLNHSFLLVEENPSGGEMEKRASNMLASARDISAFV